MTSGAKKTITISISATILIVALFYFGAHFAPKKIVKNLSASFEKQFSRKLELGKISYSVIDGITVKDIRISHPLKPRNIAYSIKKTAAFFELLPLLKGKLVLSKIKLENANFRLIRSKNGEWDFADIRAALPKSKNNFYSTWPRKIIAKNSEIFIIDQTSDNMWKLQNADINFFKRASYYGGSFSLSSKGILKGNFLKNKLISKELKTEIKADFENNNLNSSIGEIEFKNSACNDIRIKNINLKWNMTGINSKENNHNYKAEFKIEEVSAPNMDNPLRKNIAESFKTFAKIYGKKTAGISEINLKNISGKISFHKDLFWVQKFKIDSDIFDVNADYKFDKKTDEMDLNFKGKAFAKEMIITAKGPYSHPAIKPEFSHTIRTKLMFLINRFSKTIKTLLNGEQS